MKVVIRVLIGLAISALVLWVYVYLMKIDVYIIFTLSPLTIVCFLALLSVIELLKSYRIYLAGKGLGEDFTFKESLVAWLASRIVANLTPGFYGGETVKVAYLGVKHNFKVAIKVNVIELLSEGFAQGALAIIAILILHIFKPLMAIVLLIALMEMSMFFLMKRGICVPPRICQYITISELKERYEKAILLISVLALLLQAIAFSLFYHGSPLTAILVFLITIPSSAIPLTPGGIGIVEFFGALIVSDLKNAFFVWRVMTLLSETAVSAIALLWVYDEVARVLKEMEKVKGYAFSASSLSSAVPTSSLFSSI